LKNSFNLIQQTVTVVSGRIKWYSIMCSHHRG